MNIHAQKIIDEIKYLTLSTCGEDKQPWCTPVYTAFNQSYEFYWASGFETRHSVNIRFNNKVGATLYDSSIAVGEGQAVYMEGHAVELTPETWQDGLQLLRARDPHKADDYYPTEQFQSLGPVRIYKFTPTSFYMLSDNGDARYDIYADCRVKIEL